MSELIRMSAEQMRKQGMINAEQKRQREKEYQLQIEKMSKHNVGGYYDVRQIAKSVQLQDQKNYYDTSAARSELEDMLQSNRLYKFSDVTTSFIKKITGRDYDSYTLRETGRFLSDLINELKLKYEIKD